MATNSVQYFTSNENIYISLDDKDYIFNKSDECFEELKVSLNTNDLLSVNKLLKPIRLRVGTSLVDKNGNMNCNIYKLYYDNKGDYKVMLKWFNGHIDTRDVSDLIAFEINQDWFIKELMSL